MFEAIKIFLLIIYIMFIYLLADSLLMALSTIPIFSYLELIQAEHKNLKKTFIAMAVAFIVPAVIYFYFSFLPGRSDPDLPLSKIIFDSVLLGFFGSFIVILKRASDYAQGKYPSLLSHKRTQEKMTLLAVIILMPFLAWAHIQYKVKQEKAFDKQAEALLIILNTSQQERHSERKSYQKDLAALGFTAKTDRYAIYLDRGQLPLEYAQVVNAETQPYVEKNSYRALLALKNPHSHTLKFFIGNDQGEVKQLKSQLPLSVGK